MEDLEKEIENKNEKIDELTDRIRELESILAKAKDLADDITRLDN